MFLPAEHVEKSVPVLRRLIRDHPLGVLTTAVPSAAHPLILSSHIPWVLDVADESSETDLGRLRGHMARQNPQSQAMMAAATSANANTLEQEVLVLFTAAPHHYVTPKFYVETKPTTAKVVPTWNYAAVQAYGTATVYFDPRSDQTARFLDRQLRDLSRHTEMSIMEYTGQGDRPGPWEVSDAPERYVELMTKNIIGIEIAIHRLEGKFKMSQEKRGGDRKGVVQGFENLNSDLGRDMARLVREHGDLKDAARS
ncbi:putative FMN-binding domain-containing protein [Hirsutella rhossiliensis]|uniref:FMN-binding domain-containing protein n=1 Tax=Hirsutella rhossiliensis TaxID=111463 RepID=A0A9P8SIA4_9HYPO|nr:putative FMN-binding domain-containing protein [Hirsutella rhossiliensis]KAH0962989.1 putative FMN-binding domain-containing protein [Hirsutella rhossiliensis]